MMNPLARQPFGVTARRRIEAIGPSWFYRLVYQPTSDFVHMNSRAVSNLFRPTEHGDARTGSLVVGIELLIRLLYKLNEVLGSPERPRIDSYAKEYGKYFVPEEGRGNVLAYLRGTMFAEQ